MSTRSSITAIILAFVLVVGILAVGFAILAFVLSWAFNLIAPALGVTYTLTFWPAFGLIVLLYIIGRVLNVGGGGSKS